MSGFEVTVAGYAVLVAAAALIQAAAGRPESRVPPVQDVVAAAMRSRPTRTALVAGWVWLGLHFFAR